MTERSDKYAARVDAHLPTLPDTDARRKFVTGEIDKWENRYAAFAARVDSGAELTAADGDAWDYVATICELNTRLAQLQEPAYA